ncbi:Folic acid synthesis protein [Lachnellula subtilissima]|uniref:dihydroneopterin aldolase n=1 Tax=Lachnellula subtilissima TaxID=602034 RepID=A0A8H8UEL9_9HELO|nr:Folic acid synthesis protein [Lachnellula subtilissima]
MQAHTVHYWELIQKAGQPHSTIRVRNLQTSLVVGRDAWGREGKAQPVLISASVSLREPFQSASNEDAVTGSTVHYGILSKKILDSCKLFSETSEETTPKTLSDLAREIESGLTREQVASSGLTPAPALLPSSIVKLLEIKIMLPKASLLGEGVSLTDLSLYAHSEEGSGSAEKTYVLTLHNLKIPTLIGVNPNERLSKQLVVATIKIDGIYPPASHFYHVLEEIVVKTIEESSFQTLEALAMHVGERIMKYFVCPICRSGIDPRITISLSKPTAVTFADAPVVEITLETNPGLNPTMKPIRRNAINTPQPLFPLQGRLDEWISSNDVIIESPIGLGP